MKSSISKRVVSRYLASFRFGKATPNRKPIDVKKGYHITSSDFMKVMLDKGVVPKSKGNLGGEFARDKTYFFRDLKDAVESGLDSMRLSGKDLNFTEEDIKNLKHAVVEFDLSDLPTYEDPEMPEEAGFTTKHISKERIKTVGFQEWKPIISAYAKRHNLKVKFDSNAKEPKVPERKTDERKPETKPAPKKKTEADSSVEAFLAEVGDTKVPNPNPDSRKQHPKVMIKSLDWSHQKRYYDMWK